jgi:HD-like signal output (HDOD) protein
VNSSFYGLPGQVSTVERAIVLLGLNAVKNIAVSASMSTLFRGGRICPVLDARDLWLHAVCTATTSKLIADELRLAVADEAFLAGLIHDIGLLVELQFDRARFVKVVTNAKPNADGYCTEHFRTIERDVFGADHQEFGRGLCRKWRFPDIFVQAAGYHHEPLELPAGQRSMACLIYVADRIAASLDDLNGFRMDISSAKIDPSVLDELGLTEEQVEKIRAEAPSYVDDVANLLAG